MSIWYTPTALSDQSTSHAVCLSSSRNATKKTDECADTAAQAAFRFADAKPMRSCTAKMYQTLSAAMSRKKHAVSGLTANAVSAPTTVSPTLNQSAMRIMDPAYAMSSFIHASESATARPASAAASTNTCEKSWSFGVGWGETLFLSAGKPFTNANTVIAVTFARKSVAKKLSLQRAAGASRRMLRTEPVPTAADGLACLPPPGSIGSVSLTAWYMAAALSSSESEYTGAVARELRWLAGRGGGGSVASGTRCDRSSDRPLDTS